MKMQFDLVRGIKLGEKTHQHVELRPATAGDVIDATEESEKLVYAVVKGDVVPTLVTSPGLVGSNVLRRQIVRLGEIQGPIDLDVLKRLEIDDFELLQAKADELDRAHAARATREVAARGRDDGGGGGS